MPGKLVRGWGRAAALGTAVAVATTAGGPAGAASSQAAAKTKAQTKEDLLRLSDFPSGWTSSVSQSTHDSQVGASQIATCLGLPLKNLEANAPQATSPEFDLTSKNLSVTEEVQVYSSAATARTNFAAIANPKAPACLASYLNSTVGTTTTSGTSVGTIVVGRLHFPSFGQRSSGVTVSLPVTVDGKTVPTETDVLVILDGATQATVTFSAIGSPFPPTLAHRLSAAAARRIS